MDKNIFLTNFHGLLTFKQIDTDDEKTKKYFEFMQHDFTNEQFTLICKDIILKETLYNKYPDIKLFYDRLQKKQEQRKLADKLTECVTDLQLYFDGQIFNIDRFMQEQGDAGRYAVNLQGGINDIQKKYFSFKKYREDFKEAWDNGKKGNTLQIEQNKTIDSNVKNLIKIKRI